MSVNSRFAINPKKTARLGPIFHTIDFDSNPNYPSAEFRESSPRKLPCGLFWIDNKSFKISYDDIKYQIRRMKEVVSKFYVRRDAPTEFEFDIKGRSWILTKAETERVLETFEAAKASVESRYKLGL